MTVPVEAMLLRIQTASGHSKEIFFLFFKSKLSKKPTN